MWVGVHMWLHCCSALPCRIACNTAVRPFPGLSTICRASHACLPARHVSRSPSRKEGSNRLEGVAQASVSVCFREWAVRPGHHIFDSVRSMYVVDMQAKLHEAQGERAAAAHYYALNLARLDAEGVTGADATEALLYLAEYAKVRQRQSHR